MIVCKPIQHDLKSIESLRNTLSSNMCSSLGPKKFGKQLDKQPVTELFIIERFFEQVSKHLLVGKKKIGNQNSESALDI